jgi:hypothetical protein
MPIFYFFCIAFNCLTISYQGSKLIGLETIPLWLATAISLAAGLVAALAVHYLLKPKLANWIHRKEMGVNHWKHINNLLVNFKGRIRLSRSGKR